MILKKTAFSCLLLIFIAISPAVADTLSVRVLEKGSGDAVEGATVVIGSSGEYDHTDKKGSLIFDDVEFPTKIKILSPGFETLERSISKTASEEIFYIYPITVEGEALEVVEDRVKERVSKITLVEEELRKVPGTAGDPLKILSSLPGIVNSTGGAAGPNAIYVRGSGGRDNGVLINRIPVEYLFHFGDLSGISPSVLNPALVKDFNAFLGGFPVEYDDKLGGILDVQLRQPKNDRLHQTYRAAIHEAAFLVEGPVQEANDNDSFYAAGRISYLDRILTPEMINKAIRSTADEGEEDDFSIVTLPRYYDAQANWHRDLEKGYLDAHFFAAGDSIVANLGGLEDTDPEVAGELSYKIDYQAVGVNWLHRYNNKFSHIGTWSFSQLNERQRIGTDSVTGEHFFVTSITRTATFDPQLIWRVNSQQEITTGINATRNWVPIDLYISVLPTEDNPDYNFTTAEKYRFDTDLNAGAIAPYIKHRWNITDRITSILGARFSYVKASAGIEMSAFSPRAAIEYRFNKQLMFNASWGKYVQVPLGATIVSGIGNPKLGYTQAEHRIVGAEYSPTDLWTFKLEAYHKPMEKLVLFLPDQRSPNNYTNEGEGDAYGVDLLIKRKYANRKMGWLSYSYAKSSRTTVKGQDRDFSGDQPHTLNMVWGQPMTGSWKRWTWGVKLTLHSGAPYTPIIGRNAICFDNSIYAGCADQVNAETDPDFSHWEPVDAERNSDRLPFYYLMSVRFDREIRFDTWKMNVFVDVQNLSFRKNIVGYNYGKKYDKIDDPEPVAAFYFPLPLFGIEAEF